MEIINTIRYFNIDEVVEAAITSMCNEEYKSIAIIGDSNIIKEAMNIVFEEYMFDACYIHMDEITYNDLYQLIVDEDFLVTIEPIKDKFGDYKLNEAEMQFISDNASLSYIHLLDNNSCEYQIFEIDEDYSYNEDEYNVCDSVSKRTLPEINCTFYYDDGVELNTLLLDNGNLNINLFLELF